MNDRAHDFDEEMRRAFEGEYAGPRKANGAAPHPDLSAVPLTPAAWLARQLPPPDHLMGELFSTTSRVLIAADTGLGKSMFALALALAMHLGRDFLRWRSHRPARVLVLDGEMPRDLLQERIRLACEWFDVTPPADGLFVLSREDVEDMPPLDSEDGHAWLLAVIEAVGGVDFVVLDNVSCLTVGDLREETTWRPLVPLARELSRRKIGQLWLHHVGHDKTKAYGSRTFAWQMDAVGIGSAVSRDGADVSMKIEWQKARRRTPANRADFEPVHVVLEGGTWVGTAAGTGTVPGCPTSLTPSGRVAMVAFAAALAAAGEKPPAHDVTRGVDRAVRLSTWRAYLTQTAGYEQDATGKEAERKAWNRGRESAVGASQVFIWGEWAWPR